MADRLSKLIVLEEIRKILTWQDRRVVGDQIWVHEQHVPGLVDDVDAKSQNIRLPVFKGTQGQNWVLLGKILNPS